MNNNNNVGEEWSDSIIKYIRKNRMQVFYNLILLLLVVIQGIFMISSIDNTTVEVDLPPRGKIVVMNNKANALYYTLWGEHYTNNKEYIDKIERGEKIPRPYTFSIVDFTYADVEAKYNMYLKRYKPSKLIREKHIFMKFLKNIKVKMISQTYVVESMKTKLYDDGHKASVLIKGVATQTFGTTKTKPKECSYTMNFERIGGKIYGTSLQTTCF